MIHRDSCPAGPLGPLFGRCNCYVDVATCKHCLLRIGKQPEKSADWLHAEGAQQGKHTCALDPYGFHAEPVGTACSTHPANPCNGSRNAS